MNRVILTIPWNDGSVREVVFPLLDDTDPTQFARELDDHLRRNDFAIDIETTHTTRLT